MKTEIQGDFIGYFLRFKMPSTRCFSMPLKSAGLIFLFELVLSGILIINMINSTILDGVYDGYRILYWRSI